MHRFVTLAKYYNVSLDYLAALTDTPKKIILKTKSTASAVLLLFRFPDYFSFL